MSDPINLFDYETLARERLDPMVYDYYASGAHDEISLRANREAYDRIALAPRVLAGAGERDASIELTHRGPGRSSVSGLASTSFASPSTTDAPTDAAAFVRVALKSNPNIPSPTSASPVMPDSVTFARKSTLKRPVSNTMERRPVSRSNRRME